MQWKPKENSWSGNQALRNEEYRNNRSFRRLWELHAALKRKEDRHLLVQANQVSAKINRTGKWRNHEKQAGVKESEGQQSQDLGGNEKERTNQIV